MSLSDTVKNAPTGTQNMQAKKAQSSEQRHSVVNDFRHSPSRPSDASKLNMDRIESTRGKLDELIEELNGKLFSHFHRKEQELLEEYKQELIAAQKELNQLRSSTNEEQIKNKMLLRKKELEKERHQLIQTNLLFSNKCEQYKRKLGQLIAEGQEMEREIVFLDGQIGQAAKKKYQLAKIADQSKLNDQSKVGDQSEFSSRETFEKLPKFTQQKVTDTSGKKDPIRQKKAQSIYEKVSQFSHQQTPNQNRFSNSTTLNTDIKKNLLQKLAINSKKKTVLKNEYWNSLQPEPQIGYAHSATIQYAQTEILKKTPLEALFEDVVSKIRAKSKVKRTMPALNGQEFTDFEKRAIMEQFLGMEEVKQKIYDIIFDRKENPSQQGLKKQKQGKRNKIKISYEDIL